MEIRINRGHVVSFLLCIVGLYLLLSGLRNQSRIQNVISLDQISIDEVSKGQYVQGELPQYLGVTVENSGSPYFTGVSIGYINRVGKTYDYYTIPVAEQKYISMLVEEGDLKNTLEGYEEGSGTGAVITGKIIKLPTEINYTWLQDALGLNDASKVKEAVSEEYGILPVDFAKETRRIREGAVLFAISIALFFVYGGLKQMLVPKAGQELEEE